MVMVATAVRIAKPTHLAAMNSGGGERSTAATSGETLAAERHDEHGRCWITLGVCAAPALVGSVRSLAYHAMERGLALRSDPFRMLGAIVLVHAVLTRRQRPASTGWRLWAELCVALVTAVAPLCFAANASSLHYQLWAVAAVGFAGVVGTARDIVVFGLHTKPKLN
jgi:hypothetical protein